MTETYKTALTCREVKLQGVQKIPNHRQDGIPPHYVRAVRDWLDEKFPDHWIGHRETIEWAPKSPNLNPIDIS